LDQGIEKLKAKINSNEQLKGNVWEKNHSGKGSRRRHEGGLLPYSETKDCGKHGHLISHKKAPKEQKLREKGGGITVLWVPFLGDWHFGWR